MCQLKINFDPKLQGQHSLLSFTLLIPSLPLSVHIVFTINNVHFVVKCTSQFPEIFMFDQILFHSHKLNHILYRCPLVVSKKPIQFIKCYTDVFSGSISPLRVSFVLHAHFSLNLNVPVVQVKKKICFIFIVHKQTRREKIEMIVIKMTSSSTAKHLMKFYFELVIILR